MNNINVFIDGDRNGFHSKNYITKFKNYIKNNINNINIKELNNIFIKQEYLLEFINNDDYNYYFKINIKENKVQNYELKNKLKNKFIQNKRSKDISDDIPDDIYKEYKKLSSNSKLNIPSPTEIISNPDKYKQLISLMLSNIAAKKFGNNHPYIKYLRNMVNLLNSNMDINNNEIIENNNIVDEEDNIKEESHTITKKDSVSELLYDYNIINRDEDTDDDV